MSNLELGKKRAEELGLKASTTVMWSTSQGLMTGPKTFKEGTSDLYLADDIHRLLGEGVIAYKMERSAIDWHQDQLKSDDHKALLIGIRPLVQESDLETKMMNQILSDIAYKQPLVAPFVNKLKRLLESDKGEK